MDPEKKRTIFTICCIAVIIIAAVLLAFGGRQSEPPGLTVSNELGQKIKAQRGTYTWKTGGGSVVADSPGPLALYGRGELKDIETSENDDYSLKLYFNKEPNSVAVAIYPESAAATQDHEARIRRDVTGSRGEYRFTVPHDGVFIVEVFAEWEKGNCYYYFYTTN